MNKMKRFFTFRIRKIAFKRILCSLLSGCILLSGATYAQESFEEWNSAGSVRAENYVPLGGNIAQIVLDIVENETSEESSSSDAVLFTQDEADQLMYRYAETIYSNSVGAYWSIDPVDYRDAPYGSEVYYCYAITSYTGAAGYYYLNKYNGDVSAQWAPPHHNTRTQGYVWEEPYFEINLVEWLRETDSIFTEDDRDGIEVSGYLGRTVAEVMEAIPDLVAMGEDGIGLFGKGVRFDVRLTGKADLGQEIITRVYVQGNESQNMIHGLRPGVNPDDPYAEADCILEPAGSTEYWDEDNHVIVLYDSRDESSPYIFYYDPALG